MNNHLKGNSSFSFQLEKQMMNSFLKTPGALTTKENAAAIKKEEEHPLVENLTQQALVKRIEKLESLLNLYSDLYQQSGKAEKIDELTQITGKDFLDNYYFRNKPVILKSLMKDWPAMEKWRPDYFSKQYGHVPVEITKGREKEQAYERNFRRTVATIPFGEFIDQIKQHSSSNDIYIVARNYFFSNPQFHALRDDIIPPGEIIDTTYAGLQNMKLWFGPCGTVTPLHHDKHSILFCQVYGRKHFKMIPSFELPKIYNRDRYYSEVDPEHIDPKKYPLFLKAAVTDVIINPGEILFIPAGWWHWVRSLDVSISVTFSNFQVAGYNTTWNCE